MGKQSRYKSVFKTWPYRIATALDCEFQFSLSLQITLPSIFHIFRIFFFFFEINFVVVVYVLFWIKYSIETQFHENECSIVSHTLEFIQQNEKQLTEFYKWFLYGFFHDKKISLLLSPTPYTTNVCFPSNLNDLINI